MGFIVANPLVDSDQFNDNMNNKTTKYHPHSCWPTLFQKFEEFGIKDKTLHTSPVDSIPWKPFKTQGNHHIEEIALDAGLNKAQVDGLLTLFSLVSQGKEQVIITTDAELQKVCNNMGAELTPFSKHIVSAPYKGKSMEFKVHTQLIWNWALNLLTNPQFTPHFIWDAKHIYSQLPDNVENATKLLSHSTVKGYPIVVWCANLPNVGGGCIVPKELVEKGKLGYTTLKCVIWHESTLKLFEAMIHFSKAGFKHHCQNGKAPCPVCLVPLEELHDLLKTFALCNAGQGEDTFVFWLIRYSDPHVALSFDCLHSLHLGLWGKHLLKIILRYLGCGAEATVEGLVKEFPHWCKLSHFKAILKVSFSNGNKLAVLSIQVFYAALNVPTHAACPEGHLLMSLISSYLQHDSLIGLNIHTNCTLSAIEAELLVFNERLQVYKEAAKKSFIPGLKVDWDFPKTHLWRHVMHGPLKEAYQDHSNKRDVASQILHVDQHVLACKLLHTHVDYYDKWHQSRNGEHSDNGDDDDLLVDFKGHFMLRSLCKPTTIQEIKTACDTKDKAYLGFQRKFTKYINEFLPSIGHGLTRWLIILHHFKMCEYHYLKINYKSWVDWTMATDYLQCNPEFYGAPHYDCAYVQLTSMQTAFVCLVSLFTCQIDNFGEVQLVVVQPYTAGIGQQCRLDQNMKLTCIRAVPRGALVFADPQKKDKFLVVDHIDSDMFL
ncbi:hypothetical protein V8B97DRAFT_2025115 [Scleroderma yunnanense]